MLQIAPIRMLIEDQPLTIRGICYFPFPYEASTPYKQTDCQFFMLGVPSASLLVLSDEPECLRVVTTTRLPEAWVLSGSSPEASITSTGVDRNCRVYADNYTNHINNNGSQPAKRKLCPGMTKSTSTDEM
ncbi:hypothetical protein PNOK_0149400 [Pyrrhoderma noxium]|uniref:Uncharacterized protein n=1 Tax=Pyrrhoderma noxium TaxID=2282107 RepID=A0A286UPL6_9AGAM|nr:hypothetical protein PNOK_0149400 [Pyrrhoderma noxium]